MKLAFCSVQLLCFALLPLAAREPVRADAPPIAVIVHPSTGVRKLDRGQLQDVYMRRRLRWPGGRVIVPLNQPAGSPLRVEFDRVVLDLGPDAVAKYWVDQRIRDGTNPPTTVASLSTLVKVVSKLGGSIGYVPADLVTPDVRVVARIEHGRMVGP